jgi:seryl-tRNA synthetase
MKNLYLLTIIFLSLSFIAFSQPDRNKFLKQRNKIHQLEKLKLIEVLDMDENTSIKFFARRNEMQNEIESLQDKEDEILSKLEETIKSDEKNNETTQRQLINDLQNVKDKIESAKKHFINSLNDILSTEKIVKYIVFEQKFRDEIRRIILDRRRPPND